MKAQTIILGNVITMDEFKPYAQAIAVAEHYKAVLPLLGYYQFMDKFFTPGYLLDIVAARK